MTVQNDWTANAACQGEDPELFFPLGEDGETNTTQISEAKSVCFRCTVAASCLEWAFSSGSNHGIFGGMTAEERRIVRAQWLAFQLAVDQTSVSI